MSNSKVNLRDFEKYSNIGGYRKRIVNQREIFEWLKEKGPMTESKIFSDIYNFYRGGFQCNKKYADCLRRLLATGKIGRRKNNKNVFEYLTVVPDFDTNIPSNETKAEVKETIDNKPSPKSQLQNFDVVEIRGGNIYLVCIDKELFINLKSSGYNNISDYNDDLINKCWGDYWDIMKIYKPLNDFSISYITDFENNKDKFEQIYKRVDVKTHTYTKERLKNILGISSTDVLVVED